MTALDAASFFDADPAVLDDPYPFYEAVRREGPIVQEPHHGIFVVTKYDDILEISNRHDDFSAVTAATGPWVAELLPKRPEVEFGAADLSSELEERRSMPGLDAPPVLVLDPPSHTDYRSLINRLFRPARLRDMEERLREMAVDLVDDFPDGHELEYFEAFASPYPFLAISELFGIPRDDQDVIREHFRVQRHAADEMSPDMREALRAEGAYADGQSEAQRFMDAKLAEYLEARRVEPRGDVLSDLANARFPDGSLPEIADLLRVAAVVYGAGQETTVRLLTNGMLILAKDPALQRRLRDDPDLVEGFVDEVLRFESPVKGLFRWAKRDAEVDGVRIPAGSIIWLCYAAANRDPEHFECPNDFDPARATAKHNVAFGHGAHFCPGSPLARTEGRLAFTALLDRIENIELHPTKNDFQWVQWFVLRGLSSLHITFDRAGTGASR